MAALEVIALDTSVPQLMAPQAGDTYTFPRAVEMPLGTANGVLFLNGSKVVSSGSALTFDGSTLTNTGVGYSVNNANALLRFGNAAATRTGYLQVRSDAFEIWSDQAAVPMVFGVANAEQMRLTSTGLGIGTSSPAYRLDVSTALTGTAAGDNTAIALNSQASGRDVNIRLGDSVNATARIGYLSGALYMYTNAAERLRITTAGNVGIGTSSGGYKLTVAGGNAVVTTSAANGTSGFALFDAVSGGNHIGSLTRQGNGIDVAAYDQISFRTGATSGISSGSEQMRLTSTGLGIGTSSPAQRLDVYGNGMKVNNASYTGYIGADSVFGSSGVASSLTIRSDNALTFSTGGPYTRATLDSSGNLGLGVTPSAWNGSFRALQIGPRLSIYSDSNSSTIIGNNSYNDAGGTNRYLASAPASLAIQFNGGYQWLTAPSGTAGDAISFTQALTLTAASNLKLGGTADRATTAGTNHLDIFNGTAPVGTLANGISLYSDAGEAYVMDATGNATLISPHDAETNEWIFRSKHTPTGKVLKIDVERLLRFVNDHFGLDAVQEFVEA